MCHLLIIPVLAKRILHLVSPDRESCRMLHFRPILRILHDGKRQVPIANLAETPRSESTYRG